MKTAPKFLVLLTAGVYWIVCNHAFAQYYPVPNAPKGPGISRTPTPSVKKADMQEIKEKDLFTNFDFGSWNLNRLALWSFELQLDSGESIQSVSIAKPGGSTTDTSANFKVEYQAVPGSTSAYYVAVGFVPAAKDKAEAVLTFTINGVPKAGQATTMPAKTVNVSGTGIDNGYASSSCPATNVFPTLQLGKVIDSTTDKTMDKLNLKLANDFDAWAFRKDNVVKCYFGSNNMASVFTQVQSIYNAAAGSTNVEAEIASLNFNFGPEISIGTNYQTGSTAPSATTAASPNPAIPTLAKTDAAQAAQNLLWGGNIYVYAFLPIFTNMNAAHDNWNFNGVISAREGVDVQNFSGATITATNPTTHFGIQGEGYAQWDGLPAMGSSASPGSVFIGGRYGYAYTSNQYRKQYGFASTSAQVSQASFGFKLSNAKIAVFKSFGPAQTYVDSTSNQMTKQNNFHSLSFAISYQK